MYDALSRALLSRLGLGVETPVNPQETLIKFKLVSWPIFLSLYLRLFSVVVALCSSVSCSGSQKLSVIGGGEVE